MKTQLEKNPLNYDLRLLDYVEVKCDMGFSDEENLAKIDEAVKVLGIDLVAWRMGVDNNDFMMNQFTVHLFVRPKNSEVSN